MGWAYTSGWVVGEVWQPMVHCASVVGGVAHPVRPGWERTFCGLVPDREHLDPQRLVIDCRACAEVMAGHGLVAVVPVAVVLEWQAVLREQERSPDRELVQA